MTTERHRETTERCKETVNTHKITTDGAKQPHRDKKVLRDTKHSQGDTKRIQSNTKWTIKDRQLHTKRCITTTKRPKTTTKCVLLLCTVGGWAFCTFVPRGQLSNYYPPMAMICIRSVCTSELCCASHLSWMSVLVAACVSADKNTIKMEWI